VSLTFSSPLTASGKTRGFSLIEAAIVLAIVGLVVGAIFVAMQSARENLKREQTLQGILQIIDHGRRLWGRDGNMPTGLFYSNDNGNTAVAIAAGMAPQDWVKDASNLVSPYGMPVYVRAGDWGAPAVTPSTVAVLVIVPSTAAANNIISFFSGANFTRYRLLSNACYQWNGVTQSGSFSGGSSTVLAACPAPLNGQIHVALAFYP